MKSDMRKDDAEQKTFFRSEERVFQVNGEWWFALREGDRGPFASRDLAFSELSQFMLDNRAEVELDDVSRLDKSARGASGWDVSDL